MADIKDALRDILKHTHGLEYEMVRISNEATETLIDTVDTDKTVILKAKMHNRIDEFGDNTVGLSRMKVLDGYLSYPGFKDSKVNVSTLERDGIAEIDEIEFVNNEGTTAQYRFMRSAMIESQLAKIDFKGATYDISFEPTKKNINDLSYFCRILADYESTFTPKTEDGKLYFVVGDVSGDRTKMLINDDVKGDFTREFAWPVKLVIEILKLGEAGENMTISISQRGLMEIKVDSGLGEYTYFMPPKG